jgi:thiamine kinase-like enzyme
VSTGPVAGKGEASAEARAASLPLWRGPVTPLPLGGGMTNRNFLVADGDERFVVRVGDDMPVHHVLRFNERAASEAAHRAGISPEFIYAEPGVMVMRYVDGRTLAAADVREPARLARIVPLIRRVHREMPLHLRGPLLAFWVFHVVRDYAHTLEEAGSRHGPLLAGFVDLAGELEKAVGPVELVFGHNDLLPANLLDDGSRIWLIDWDYGGFNSPLFDLANIATNCSFGHEEEQALLELYFGGRPSPDQARGFAAMKIATLLRETMWSMVSEVLSMIDFDYAAYTAEQLGRLEHALADWRATGG